jgi:hypothetical protein
VSTSLDVAPWELEAAADDVEDSRSAACWSIEECDWAQVLPGLPDEMVALLATPVVVSAEALGGKRAAEAAAAHGEAAGPKNAAPVQRVEPADHPPRFLAPAPPRRRRGKHRRPAAVAR